MPNSGAAMIDGFATVPRHPRMIRRALFLQPQRSALFPQNIEKDFWLAGR